MSWGKFRFLLAAIIFLAFPLNSNAQTDIGISSKYSLSYSWPEFTNKWAERHELMAAGNFADADQILREILTMKELSSWNDLFPLAAALRHEAAYQSSQKELARAALYYQVATALAPDDFEGWIQLAWFNFKHHIFNPKSYLKPLAKAGGLVWHDWWQKQRFLGSLFPFAVWFLLFFGIIFLLCTYFRHLRATLHDYGHLFPYGTPRWLTTITMILLLLLPTFFNLGVIWFILIYGLFIWWSMTKLERLTYSIYLAVLVLFSLFLPQMVKPYGAVTGPRLSLYLAAVDPSQDENNNQLLKREFSSRGQDANKIFNGEELYILGLRAIKSGSLAGLSVQGSYELGKKYLQLASRYPNLAADSYNALGVIHSIQNHSDEAEKALHNALKAAPHHLVANFNLSRLYYSKTETDKAQNYMHQANDINNTLAITMNDVANKYGFSYLTYPDFNHHSFGDAQPWEIYFIKQYLVPQIWARMAAGSRGLFIFCSIGLWLLLFAITSFIKAKPASICPRCGRPRCTTCYPDLENQSNCYDCYQSEVLRTMSDEEKANLGDNAAKVKNISYFKYLRRQKNLATILAIIIPPANFHLKGRRRSLIYTIIFSLAISMSCVAFGLIELPFITPSIEGHVFGALAIVLWIALGFISYVRRNLETK